MDINLKKRYEYEEQIFNFSSKLFFENFKSFTMDEIESTLTRLVNSIRTKLLKESKNPEEFDINLKIMLKSLRGKYKESFKTIMPELELQIGKQMNIPDHVLLKEDLPVKIARNRDISDLEREMETLKQSLKSKAYMKQAILEEINKAESTIPLLENAASLKKISFKVLEVDNLASNM